MSRFALAALIVLSVSPAMAGVYYEAVTNSEGSGPPMTITVRAWVDGEQAKVEFASGSTMGFFCEGCYLLKQTTGNVLHLVNPQEGTYSEWDLDAMTSMLGNVMDSPMLNMEIVSPESEKTLEEKGESILGKATTHYKWRTRYDMEIKVMGFGQKQTIDSVQDFWTTTDLSDAGMNVWLRNEPPKTGLEDFDQFVATEMQKIEGFPLKTVTVTTTTGQKGKSTTTTETMEVTVLRDESIAAGTFDLPEGLQEVPMATSLPSRDLADEEVEEQEESPFKALKGVFGGRKKN